jgi:hypothetical protein
LARGRQLGPAPSLPIAKALVGLFQDATAGALRPTGTTGNRHKTSAA